MQITNMEISNQLTNEMATQFNAESRDKYAHRSQGGIRGGIFRKFCLIFLGGIKGGID